MGAVGLAVEALNTGADIIMLDNMAVGEMKKVVELARGRSLVEASGGITLDNVRQVAETGVDLISIGVITHSAKALDLISGSLVSHSHWWDSMTGSRWK